MVLQCATLWRANSQRAQAKAPLTWNNPTKGCSIEVAPANSRTTMLLLCKSTTRHLQKERKIGMCRRRKRAARLLCRTGTWAKTNKWRRSWRIRLRTLRTLSRSRTSEARKLPPDCSNRRSSARPDSSTSKTWPPANPSR